MKILRLFLAIVFIISLLAGFWAGHTIFQPKLAAQPIQTTDQDINFTSGTQEGVWLIAVDHITETTPQIKGIWLLTFIIGYNKLKPLPFFPTENAQNDAELEAAFHLDNNHQISPAFWESLKKRGQPIQNYIIFDEVAASAIITQFGGVTIDGKHMDGLEVIAQSQDIRQDPQSEINNQIAIMNSLCKNIFTRQSVSNFESLQLKMKSHSLSNIDPSIQLAAYQKLTSGNYTNCEFPDLYKKPAISAKP